MLKDEFIKRARAAHGDKYDYSHVPAEFKTTDKIIIICQRHGEFAQQAIAHYRGQGCPSCAIIKRNNANRKSKEQWIRELNVIHNNEYDYKLFPDKIGVFSKVRIICEKHGEFIQELHEHHRGQGCPRCGSRSSISTRMKGTKYWIDKALKSHKKRYNYNLINEEITGTQKVKIICPAHGEFEQRMKEHIQGQGCPRCFGHISRAEDNVADYINQFTPVLRSDRTIIKPQELDIILPERKAAVEYCGLYWHSDAQKVNKNYHLQKLEAAQAVDYRLITIFENEWLNRQEQVKAILRRASGVMGERVFARKCNLEITPKQDRKAFFDANHIQGDFAASICYGLRSHGELLACMSFKKSYNCVKDGQYELTRFAVKDGYSVIGAAGRLFKAFLRDYDNPPIISYCDRRYFTGGLYTALGFKQTRILPPDNWYVKGQNLFNKRVFRHGNFGRAHWKGILPEWDDSWSEKGNPNYKTERQIMELNKYNKIWDCGKLVFEWMPSE